MWPRRLDYLKTLDLTNLQYTEYFQLEALGLEKFSLDELKEFTGPEDGGVQVMVGPKVENLDGLFRNNLDPWRDGASWGGYDGWMASGSGVDLNSITAPNLKSLTFGWKRIPQLAITTGGEVSVVFGGPNSTGIEIRNLKLSGGVVKLGRGQTVKKFKVGRLEVRDAEKVKQLEVPFDELGSLEILNATALTSVILPPQAESWNNFSLSINKCPNLTLSSEYTIVDGEHKKTWYWPRGDWLNLVIWAKMANGFL